MKFTNAEINHLLSLIEANERDGWYYAPRDQYWKRSERIKAKLKSKWSKE